MLTAARSVADAGLDEMLPAVASGRCGGALWEPLPDCMHARADASWLPTGMGLLED